MNTAKKIRSMMLAMAALLTFGFAFTSCSNDEDFPSATNTVSFNGTTGNVRNVVRESGTAFDGGTTNYYEIFYVFINDKEGAVVNIPTKHLGKTMDLTEKWGIDGDIPNGLYLAFNDKEYAFFSPDENGDFPGNIKEGTMTVTVSDGKVYIYAKGIGLQYDKNHPEADPVEMPFEVSYSGPYTIEEIKET